jgi:hypothetical protein
MFFNAFGVLYAFDRSDPTLEATVVTLPTRSSNFHIPLDELKGDTAKESVSAPAKIHFTV